MAAAGAEKAPSKEKSCVHLPIQHCCHCFWQGRCKLNLGQEAGLQADSEHEVKPAMQSTSRSAEAGTRSILGDAQT